MIRLAPVIDDLPHGFDAMRAEAAAEGYRHLERLAAEWASRAMRFDREGEALLAAHVNGAYRMRRFYVRPPFRRQGIGRELALALIEPALRAGRLITVNAGNADAPAFWVRLGFAPDMRDGHTHVLYRVHSEVRPH
jgi:GNAT superfamily N-acetyltransferase